MTNKELIQSLYAAFGRGDVPTVLGMFSPDIVWNEAENFVYADRNPYIGPQAILEGLFMRLGAEWEGLTVTPEKLVAEGDTVIGLGRYTGLFRATGTRVNAQFVHVWTVSNSLVLGFQQYTDTAQMRDAVTSARSASV
jgi:ketosteroid isomerase-like protein